MKYVKKWIGSLLVLPACMLSGCMVPPGWPVKDTDQKLLENLAQYNIGSPAARCDATSRLLNASVLEKIARSDSYPEVRKCAVERVSNQAVLAQVTMTDRDPDVRKAAAVRLTDQGVLAVVAQSDGDAGVREAATLRLADPKLLLEVALKDAAETVRRAALSRLTDTQSLAVVATTDDNPAIRLAAIPRLSDLAVLAGIQERDPSPRNQRAAKSRVRAIQGAANAAEKVSQQTITTGDVPVELRVEGPQVAAVHATGFQVYTCAADAAGKLAWTLKAPDATFEGAGGMKGKHYAGPTWAADDGSMVVGKKIRDHASPAADAVPWLLLEAASHDGTGSLAHVTYIQRIHTSGGKAPPVGNARAGDEVRVAYSADYVFYGPGATPTVKP